MVKALMAWAPRRRHDRRRSVAGIRYRARETTGRAPTRSPRALASGVAIGGSRGRSRARRRQPPRRPESLDKGTWRPGLGEENGEGESDQLLTLNLKINTAWLGRGCPVRNSSPKLLRTARRSRCGRRLRG